MISQELQLRIHNGDKEAFKSLYEMKAKEVYMTALKVLDDEEKAKAAVKQVFLHIKQELADAAGPMDVDERLVQLLESEIRIRQLVKSDGAGYAASATAVTWASIAGEIPVDAPAAPPVAEPASAPAFSPAAEPGVTPEPVPEPVPEAPAGKAEETKEDGAQGLPPLTRAQAYMQSDPSYERDGEVFPGNPPKKRKLSAGTVLLKALIVFFLALFIWVLVGILMDLRVLPGADLGYTWFNRNIFALFNA